MLANYAKVSFRTLIRNKSYTVINIMGLAIGIACFYLILLYIQDEMSYDRYFANSENIYRIAIRGNVASQEYHTASTSSLMSRTVAAEYPEVIRATRLHYTPNMLVRYGDKVFNETRFMWVDTNFMDMFSAPVVYGNPETILKDDHTLVMTLSTAQKYFDDPSQCIGEIVEFEDGTPYRIAGVVEDPPENMHFHYNMLCPLSSWEWNFDEFWLAHFMYTYIELHPDADPALLEAKFSHFIKKYLGEHYLRVTGLPIEDMENSPNKLQYFLQPMQSIHLHSHLDAELEPNSDIRYIYIFSIIALFILGIAVVNFMNLSTARSAGRGKEVGMRKVLGSTRNDLIFQFLIESIILVFLSMVIALVLVWFALPYFNQLAGKQLEFDLFGKGYTIPFILTLTIVTGLLSGSYPAFFLSAFQPVRVLKEHTGSCLKGSALRRILVVFQFMVSAILFICTFTVQRQLNYIQEQRIGYEKENIVVIKRGWAIGQKPDGELVHEDFSPVIIESFKTDLKRNPQIKAVSGVFKLPGESYYKTELTVKGASTSEQHMISVMDTDYDFPETFGIEIVEGRYFSREFEPRGIVINEAAAKTFGLEKPYTENVFTAPGDTSWVIPIIGVVRDFNFESLHKPIEPLAIGLHLNNRTYICARVRPENMSETLKYIETTWNEYIPYKPFEYFFLDEHYNNLYQTELKTGKLFTVFAVLAIVIACLGLLGLASYSAARRTREIGIRKVLGASAVNISVLLSREFAVLVLLANLIAVPVSWFFMNRWLQNFVYRTKIGAGVFVFTIVTTMLIAIITVWLQTLHAALLQPAETLKYE